MIRKHVDGFLYCQVVHMDLSVCCTSYQNSVPSMRKELCGQKKKHNNKINIKIITSFNIQQYSKKNYKHSSLLLRRIYLLHDQCA